MSVWLVGFICLALLMLIGFLSIQKDSKRDAARAAELLYEIERKYEDFIARKEMTHEMPEKEVLALCEEAVLVVKPEIKSLIVQINASGTQIVDIDFQSFYFKNAVSMTESLFTESYKNKKLSPAQEQMYTDAFKDAIYSDLIRKRIS